MIRNNGTSIGSLNDWKMNALGSVHVSSIDYDGSYDSIVVEGADTSKKEWPRSCNLKHEDGTAHLIAVMDDGARVGVTGGAGNTDDPVCDEPTRVILTMFKCSQALNMALSMIEPDRLNGLMDNIEHSRNQYEWVSAGRVPAPALLDMLLKKDMQTIHKDNQDIDMSDYEVLLLWIDLANRGFLIRPKDLFTMSVFLDNDLPDDRKRVPRFIVGQLRNAGFASSVWTDLDTHSLNLADFKGNDRMAWAFVGRMLADRSSIRERMERLIKYGRLINRLTDSYVDENIIGRINGLLDDSDYPGLEEFIGFLIRFFDGSWGLPMSWDWLLDMLERAKACNWDMMRVAVGIAKDNEDLASETNDALMAALEAHSGFQPYSCQDGMMSYMASDEALAGARLLASEDVVGYDPAPSSATNYEKSLYFERPMGLIGFVYNCMYGMVREVPSSKRIVALMRMLEDIDRAHEGGVDLMDLDCSVRDFEEVLNKNRDQDMISSWEPEDTFHKYKTILKFVHWVVNGNLRVVGFPYPFYSELPGFTSEVLDKQA